MCWMTLRNESDALASGFIATRYGESHSGGDSWGYAYVDDDDELVVHKEVGEMPEDRDLPETDMALVHTRLTTRGNINWTNAHPMKITDGPGNVIAAMAHNGTWYEAPDDSMFSDTWYMARELERNYRKSEDFEEAFVKTARKVGETMVALTKDKVGYVYAGRFSIHKSGSKFQSTGYSHRVLSGDVKKITPDGEVETVQRGMISKKKRYAKVLKRQ